MTTSSNIESYILQGLDCEHINITGDGRHFYATIVANAFEGKRTLARHQLIYGILGDCMKEEIHALSIKTFTPTEWAKQHG